MMDNDYSIENLVKRFEIHRDYAHNQDIERAEKYRKEYNSEPPKYGPDPEFCVADALLSMCKEIEIIKRWKERIE